jgi:transposase-like protein
MWPGLGFRGRNPERQKGLGMSKQSMREETERLVKEAMERNLAVKQGKTRLDVKCGKCGAPNRVFAAPGESRVKYKCKECDHEQRTL